MRWLLVVATGVVVAALTYPASCVEGIADGPDGGRVIPGRCWSVVGGWMPGTSESADYMSLFYCLPLTLLAIAAAWLVTRKPA